MVALRDKSENFSELETNDRLVRFCCNNKSTCNERFIRKYFNMGVLMGLRIGEGQDDFQILLGKPIGCELEFYAILKNHLKYSLVSVK